MCQLTVLARLLFDRVLSYPGSLGECNFTGNVGLGRLHCLSDCVLSLCKSVCSYLVFASLTANASRIVGVCFMALSKPVSPLRDALMLLARIAHSAWPFTLRRLWWSWGESNPLPVPLYFHFCRRFHPCHDHVHCGPTNAHW